MAENTIKTVAVIGAGDMGHGIAEVALLSGRKVSLYDVSDAALEKGRDRIFDSVQKLAEKGKVPAESISAIRDSLLTTTTDLAEAVSNADLAVEAVPELMDLKQQVFRQLDEAAPTHALLASNTSTMSITELAAQTKRPEQVLGLHFFNPAVIMKLVEVVRGDTTSDATIKTGMEFVQSLGKVPILVRRDTPGFIVNRVNAAPAVLMQEIVERGDIDAESLDAFHRKLGMPIGPCELTDFVGIDVAVCVGRYFAQTLHPDYAPPPHLVAMMDRGDLGKKSGRGYYDWSKGRPEIDLSKATKRFNPLWSYFAQINEATKLIDDGVCSVADVDKALVLASGNPLGPMTVGRSISHWDLTDQLEQLAQRYDKEIFRPTQRVRDGGYKH